MRPVAAAASSRSVWRQRKAGICRMSQTAATSGDLRALMHVGQHRKAVVALDQGQQLEPVLQAVPRGPAAEVRLALSNEPLKTRFSSGYATRSTTSCSATARQTASLSSEQGPAMTVSLAGSWSMMDC
jgi:hypothetical protein